MFRSQSSGRSGLMAVQYETDSAAGQARMRCWLKHGIANPGAHIISSSAGQRLCSHGKWLTGQTAYECLVDKHTSFTNFLSTLRRDTTRRG
eukprot:m.42283 g.42283  ORF g.42283 m.42283 type:complete len:91 (-) comp10669_c0_seq3:1636-1908(-)